MSDTKNIKIGKKVIQIEAQAVSAISDRLDEQFDGAVHSILDCKGRLIILGVGKSGLISQKIASTIQFCQVNLNAILRYLGIATEMVQKKL